jgi:hypothetical protein
MQNPLLVQQVLVVEVDKNIGFGQFDFSDVTRDMSMLVSLYMRSRKLTHLACPMVCPPGNFWFHVSLYSVVVLLAFKEQI